MLAQLVRVPLAVIRRWHRCGLIVPVREVRKLPYFDFQEVATARRLAELLAAGMSPRTIERRLASLARYLPGVERPLAQLSVIIRGKEILLRQGDGLIEPGGQLRFDFDAAETGTTPTVEAPPELVAENSAPAVISLEDRRAATEPPLSADQMCQLAAEYEDEGNLETAGEMYRAAMAAGALRPEICFQLAELLYRTGDLSGARERYYMAIELDEDYVEARANLGCVLAETGRRDLAVAAFEGALRYHKGLRRRPLSPGSNARRVGAWGRGGRALAGLPPTGSPTVPGRRRLGAGWETAENLSQNSSGNSAFLRKRRKSWPPRPFQDGS